MAVYERTYRPYEGAYTAPRWRFLVLPRYGVADVFRSRLLTAFLLLCGLPFLVFAGWFYLPHNLAFLETFGVTPDAAQEFLSVDGSDFENFMWVQLFLTFVLALAVGPALISPDLRNNGLPLYLSRPFARWEYVLGKASVLFLLLSVITWVPGLLLFGWQAYLGGWSWTREHGYIALAVLGGFGIWILVLTLLSLALSAYLRWKPLARVALIGVFFVSSTLAFTINLMFRTTWGWLLDIGTMISVVWGGLLRQPQEVAVPVWAAGTALAVVCGLSLLLLRRKLQAYEVVR